MTRGTGRDRLADPSRDVAARRRTERLAHLLDDRFAVPGTNWRFGLDGLLGLVPGVGDAVTTVLSAYIILEARRLGVPAATLGRMVANVGVDFVVGTIPVVGDLFDIGWKANRRNLKLLLRHLDRYDGEAPGSAATTVDRERGAG